MTGHFNDILNDVLHENKFVQKKTYFFLNKLIPLVRSFVNIILRHSLAFLKLKYNVQIQLLKQFFACTFDIFYTYECDIKFS